MSRSSSLTKVRFWSENTINGASEDKSCDFSLSFFSFIILVSFTCWRKAGVLGLASAFNTYKHVHHEELVFPLSDPDKIEARRLSEEIKESESLILCCF